MRSLVVKNWPGLLSIALAVAGAGFYALGIISGPDQAFAGKLGPVAIGLFQLSTTLALVIGVAAVARARRSRAGLVTAIIGLALGGTLTFLWVAWIGMLMLLNPPGLGE